MKCTIAKANPVLMDLAIDFYLNRDDGKGSVFTFKSLYSDDEPYPMDELLIMLNERIEALERNFKQYPSDTLAIQLSVLRKKFDRLNKLNQGG